MSSEIRTTDAKARLSLPKHFANSIVIVDQLSETEIRIRKARVIPEYELKFAAETRAPLSDRDRERFLEMLENPPKPNAALKRAAAKYKARHE